MKRAGLIGGAITLSLGGVITKLIGAIYRIPLTNVLGAEGFKKDANEETEVSDRPGYIGGVLLPSRSTQFLCSDRGLLLANGISLVSGESSQGRVVKLERKDLNELALLMGIGSRVSVVYDDSAFQQEVPSSAD